MSRLHKARNPSNWSRRSRGMALAALSAALLAGCGDTPEQMLASARTYLDKNDLNAASIQLKNALQEDGNFAEARFLLGKINLEQGDVPGAVKEFQRAFDLGYAREQVVPLLARALVRSAQFDKVLKDFVDIKLDDASASAALLAAVGDAYLGKAEVPKARTSFEAALAASAEDDLARMGLARAKLFGGDAPGAETEIRAAIARSPSLAEAHAVLADILLAQGKGDEAEAALKEASRVEPKAVNYHFALVSLQLRQNKLEEATSSLAAMKKAAPAHPSTRYLQAFIDFRNNKLTEARDGVLQALKQAPDFLPAQLLAGTVLVRLNDQVQGRSHLNRVLERAPMQPLARSMLVMSHLSSGEASRALEVLQPMLERPTQDARLFSLAGQVYLANAEYDKAEAYFQQAAKAAPEDAGARMRLGVARMATGDASGAFADLEAASGMDADAIQADLALVISHLRSGQLDKALEAQAQLERKQPDNPLVHNLRGGVMLAKRDVPAARAAFEKALSLRPDYLSAAINLARIDLAEKRPADALGRLKAIVDRDAKNVEARLAYAELQRTTGAAPAEVLKTLEQAEAAAPGALQATLAIAQHHLRVRDFPKALAVAQKASAAFPSDQRALAMLAGAQLASGDTQQAISSLNKLATLLPKSTAPLVQLADVHRGNKDNAAAEQALRKALGINPEAIEVQQRLAAIMVERGDRDGALGVARNVQKQHPEAPAGHVLEAEILANNEKWAEAAASYRRAIERKAGGEVAARLHVTLLRADRKAEADKFAADWLRQQPRELAMRQYLGERALAERRYADALALFRAMHELAPENALVLNNLAWTANKLDDPKTLEYAEQAVALAPDNPAVLDTLGVIQVDKGQADKGLANLTRAVSLAPELAPLRLNLAKAYASTGRSADARKELETLMPKLKEGTPLHTEATALMKTL